MSGSSTKTRKIGPSVLCIQGSPRKRGNTAALVEQFARGVEEAGLNAEILNLSECEIKPCAGCLRCNVLERCVIKGDDWPKIAAKFRKASGVLFATPIYFFSMTGHMKLLIDRFRSLVHVKLAPAGDGLEHKARFDPDKEYALIMVMGGLAEFGCDGLKDLFDFLASDFSHLRERKVDALICKGLAMEGQVLKTAEELETLYKKLAVEGKSPKKDHLYNQSLLAQAQQMGRRMAERILGAARTAEAAGQHAGAAPAPEEETPSPARPPSQPDQ